VREAVKELGMDLGTSMTALKKQDEIIQDLKKENAALWKRLDKMDTWMGKAWNITEAVRDSPPLY
jgi:prefoldin subunit 5